MRGHGPNILDKNNHKRLGIIVLFGVDKFKLFYRLALVGYLQPMELHNIKWHYKGFTPASYSRCTMPDYKHTSTRKDKITLLTIRSCSYTIYVTIVWVPS